MEGMDKGEVGLTWNQRVMVTGACGKEPTCQCRKHRRPRFNPWGRKIPWRRAWQLTPIFLPGTSHGHGSLEGYCQWGHKESDTTEVT